MARQQQTIGANGSISAQTYTLEYAYNLAGQLISEKYPSGRRVAYRVDEAGRLSNVFGGGRTYASGFLFAGHGGLTSMVYGNGATESFSYNDRLQLTQQSLVKNNSVIQRYDYAYGQVDQTTGTVDATKNTGQLARVEGFIGGTPSSPTKQWQQRFSYDSIGRLERAKEVRGDNSSLVWESKFSYDRWGNRYRKASENPNSLSFIAVEETDVDKLTNRIANNTTYDEAGNTTTDTKFRNRNYRYDANGRMVWTQATSGGNDSTAVYDALGQRIATNVNNTWRYMVYDIGGKIVAEYGQSAGMSGNNQIRYIQLDRQGSTRVVTDKVGTVAARFDYQPFGEEISASVGMRTTPQGYAGTDTSRQRYALTERDEATGLDHTDWRKYENQSGRWTSLDPYNGSMSIGDPQSFNRYVYVENDPINYVDSSGLDPIVLFDGISPLGISGFRYGPDWGYSGYHGSLNILIMNIRGSSYYDYPLLGQMINFVNWGRSVFGRPNRSGGKPCDEAGWEKLWAAYNRLAGELGGKAVVDPHGPRGDTTYIKLRKGFRNYNKVIARLKALGFSQIYGNQSRAHIGGSDWSVQQGNYWLHVTVGYPSSNDPSNSATNGNANQNQSGSQKNDATNSSIPRKKPGTNATWITIHCDNGWPQSPFHG